MTDIVERLRSDSQRHDVTPDGRDYTYTATPSALEKEAADEIERLRTDNARLRAALRDISLTVDELKAGTYKSEVPGVAAIGVIARAALWANTQESD